jgi:uncharacterized protein (UPF0548 family)
MLTFFKPTPLQIAAFLQQEAAQPYSYPEVGHTRTEAAVDGYNNDFNTQALGAGEARWQAAKNAIRHWQMFPGGWAYIAPENAPIEAGTVVAMAARVLGIWWLSSCRIVYVIDEPDRYGFAYGTLPGHVERGEELFMVEQLPGGDIQYVLKAFSWPKHWMARLFYPVARAYQRTFVRESKAAMLRHVAGGTA